VNWIAESMSLSMIRIILPGDDEDNALLLGGKKKNFNKGYFDRLGDVLKLNDKQITSVYRKLESWLPLAAQLIDISFLNDNNKALYKELITQRARLFIQ